MMIYFPYIRIIKSHWSMNLGQTGKTGEDREEKMVAYLINRCLASEESTKSKIINYSNVQFHLNAPSSSVSCVNLLKT